jgi:hypothetical protein
MIPVVPFLRVFRVCFFHHDQDVGVRVHACKGTPRIKYCQMTKKSIRTGKMKTESPFLKFVSLAFAIVTGSLGQIGAQTNSVTATNAVRVLTTNYVMLMPECRSVNGQIYDPDRSKLWIGLHGIVTDVLSNAVIIQLVTEAPIGYRQEGEVSVYGPSHSGVVPVYKPTGYRNIYGAKVMILDHHDEMTGTVPKSIGDEENCSAMFVGKTNYNGNVFPLWDCGYQVPSGLLEVVTTNYTTSQTPIKHEEKENRYHH